MDGVIDEETITVTDEETVDDNNLIHETYATRIQLTWWTYRYKLAQSNALLQYQLKEYADLKERVEKMNKASAACKIQLAIERVVKQSLRRKLKKALEQVEKLKHANLLLEDEKTNAEDLYKMCEMERKQAEIAYKEREKADQITIQTLISQRSSVVIQANNQQQQQQQQINPANEQGLSASGSSGDSKMTDSTFNPTTSSPTRSSVGSLRSLGVFDSSLLMPSKLGGLSYRNPNHQYSRLDKGARPSQLITQATIYQDTQASSMFCIQVSIESFDDRLNRFIPARVLPIKNQSSPRMYSIRGPLYDIKLSRWSRIVLHVLNYDRYGGFKIEGITKVSLDHSSTHSSDAANGTPNENHNHKPISHQLRVVKTDFDENDSVVSAVCDWESNPQSVTQPLDCFCFTKGKSESDVITLRAMFTVAGIGSVQFEYPIQFKNQKEGVLERMGLGQFRLSSKLLLSSDGAAANYSNPQSLVNASKQGYVNSVWYVVHQKFDSQSTIEPSKVQNEKDINMLSQIKNEENIVAFAGYLMKKQSVTGGRVQRWFVLAPPFLLCYKNAKSAAQDFSKNKVLPQNANRGLRLTRTTRLRQAKVRSLHAIGEDGQIQQNDQQDNDNGIEFVIITETKCWSLQASNNADLKRWMLALESVISSFSVSIPKTNPIPTNERVNRIEEEEEEEEQGQGQVEESPRNTADSSESSLFVDDAGQPIPI